MLELGASSPELHREAGRAAARSGKLDWIIGVQGEAAGIVEGAVSAGFPPSRTKQFATAAEAAEFFAEFIEPGDLVLVKGSRGVKMEQVVEAVLARRTLLPATVPESRGPR